MLSHTTIGIPDVQAARRFYDPLLDQLGLALKFSEEQWAGWKSPDADRPLFIIARPFDGAAPTRGNGQMIAFLATSRLQVDACHDLAMRNGGTDEGRPGLRPDYHEQYYGAYFRDPFGNKLCVCCHNPD
ncbi:VOC family protein [Sphingomonas oryzagri]|jgi:catechol 2,3-dioxygenase-like lactoylglutathione lyase family enzyme|uniref:VOC family protein n=1 Tax=Sphingomonas oryzagri TaxID=3042314 RepID=A0ABT6N5Q0_9SPHN|nr:VOC family protein [Sphingomonas oryzagri]MDH7640415.1 VOC family protein [Sphingomonas oryzagri]